MNAQNRELRKSGTSSTLPLSFLFTELGNVQSPSDLCTRSDTSLAHEANLCPLRSHSAFMGRRKVSELQSGRSQRQVKRVHAMPLAVADSGQKEAS